MSFDPYNHSLKNWKSIETLIPKVGAHLGVCGFIPSRSFTLPGAWNVTLGLHFWPAPLQALVLLTSPKLGLWHNRREKNHANLFIKVWAIWSRGRWKACFVATPLWAKCEGEAHIPKSGNLESSGTPKNSELGLKGQNTLYWGVLSVIGKVLKCRCLNWPRVGHLDIFSPSYGQKKGRESNWQLDSRPLKVGNRPLSDARWQSAT
jgi:hypothetical protein